MISLELQWREQVSALYWPNLIIYQSCTKTWIAHGAFHNTNNTFTQKIRQMTVKKYVRLYAKEIV